MSKRGEKIQAEVLEVRRRHRAPILAIWDDGGSVEETLLPSLLGTLSGIAGRSGFVPTRHVIEAHGQWANCRATRACA